jgi:hypothetical protein
MYGEDLKVFDRVHGSGKWILEHSIRRLSEATRGLWGFPAELFYWWEAWIISAGIGFVVVAVVPDPCEDRSTRLLFSLDVETMGVKSVPAYHKTWGTWSFALPWPSLIRECSRA